MRTVIIRCSIMFFVSLCIFGCKHQYSNYCPGALNDNCLNVDAPVQHCTSDQDCAPEVCDLAGSKTCVQCTTMEAGACTGPTPVCGTDNSCRGCTMHIDCPSNACLPDGSCGTDTNVAYVDPLGADNAMCSKAMPCKKVMAALATNKPYVKFHGITDEAVTVDLAGAVTFLADPGARLTRTSNGLLFEVRGTSQVAIYDLEISGASGMNNPGISMPTGNTAKLMLTRVTVSNNTGGGISASGGTLTVTQSTISGNTGGGISVSGAGAQFDITNSLIASNGSPGTAFGGVLFSQTSGGTRRFEFNTVTNNSSADGSAVGVVCTLVTQSVTFANNIVYSNQVGGTRTQVGGAMCSWNFSDIGPDTVAGAGNINADPMFVNASQNNFHLMSNSPAKDAADPNATLVIDFDGEPRPQGPRRDMGADEIRP